MPGIKRRKMTPEALELVASRFKVMADPMRLRILHALEAGEMSVTDLTAEVAATQPNVSKHLKIMQDAGLVARRQEGNTVWYSIADPTLFQLCDLVCQSLEQRLAAQSNVFRSAVTTARKRG
jgi:ArsR family transcriptional regulator